MVYTPENKIYCYGCKEYKYPNQFKKTAIRCIDCLNKLRITKRTGLQLHKTKREICNELLVLQDNKCAICGLDFTVPDEHTRGRRTYNLDHDHENAQVRGLICCSCNAGLGMFKDNIEIMQKAILYISYFKEIEDKIIVPNIFPPNL